MRGWKIWGLLAAAWLLALSASGCEGPDPKVKQRSIAMPPPPAQVVTQPPPVGMSVIVGDAPAAGNAQAAPVSPQVSLSKEAKRFALVGVYAHDLGDYAETMPRVSVVFNRPVRAMGLPNEEPSPPVRIEPEVAGRWFWRGSSVLELVADARLPKSTAYRVTVPAGLEALDGERLQEEAQGHFETETLSPLRGDLQSHWSQPEPIDTTGPYRIAFDQPVSAAEVERAVYIQREKSDEQIALRVVARPADREEKPTEGVYALFVQPRAPLQRDTSYQLVYAQGLKSELGPVPLKKDVRWSFKTAGPLEWTHIECWGDYRGYCPHGPFALHFTNPVRVGDVFKHLRVHPAVKLEKPSAEEAQRKQRRVIVQGAFEVNTAYRWQVLPGIKDSLGQLLSGETQKEYQTTHYAPAFWAPSDDLIIESKQPAQLSLRYRNIKKITQTVTPLTERALLGMLLREDSDQPFKSLMSQWKPTDALDQWGRKAVDMASFFQEEIPGLEVKFKVEEEDLSRNVYGGLLQRSDLALNTKGSVHALEAWVWRMSDGQPCADCAVDALTVEGEVVASGRTDTLGMVRLPRVDHPSMARQGEWWGASQGWEGPPLVLRAQSGEERLYMPLNHYRYQLSLWRFSGDYEGVSGHSAQSGLIFTDRGIYRPGEKVHVRGMLRQIREDGLGIELPPAGEYILRWRDPEYEVRHEERLSLSSYGGVHSEWALPEDARLGMWAVELSAVGEQPGDLQWRTQLRVAEYRVPNFKVDVRTALPLYKVGAQLEATVEGRYLFGAPMAGAEVSWALNSEKSFFEPPESEGFRFGVPSDRFHWEGDDDEEDSAQESIRRASGHLDKQGRLKIEAGELKAAPKGQILRYTLEASVTDVDRQASSGRVHVDVHPADFYVGLRPSTGYPGVDEPFEVEVLAREATALAARTEVKGVRLELLRREWHSVKKQGVQGTAETVSEARLVSVSQCQRDVGLKEAARCTFTAPKAGEYRVVATARDASGREASTRADLWVWGGRGYWRQEDGNTIEVRLEREKYEVGDTLKVMVQNPFESAEAWVTVEREGILWQKRMTLKGESLEIPVTEEMVPNAYVWVTLARGRSAQPMRGDPGRPTFKMGYQGFAVDPQHKRLSVQLEPDAAQRFPGEEVELTVQVRDRSGRGQAAEVTVWAVDEGVLGLTGYEVPDPLPAFHQLRALKVRQTSSLVAVMAQEGAPAKGRDSGGGGDDAGGPETHLRERFESTPIFVGQVETDAQGQAKVRGKLPDNLTTYRLMAVAMTRGDQAGRGQSQLLVTQPLIARPALPRAIRLGDHFLAGVVLHSTTGAAVEATVRAQVQGGAQAHRDVPLSQTVMIPADRGVEVRFPWLATEVGEARFRFDVSGGGHSDAVELPIQVSTPDQLEVVAVHGMTPDQSVEAIHLSETIDPRMGHLSLNLASTALHGLAEHGKDLIEYPYGCIEQHASRLIPLVAFKAMLDRGQRDWIDGRDPKEIIAKAVQAMGQMQRPDGGFGYWPGAQSSHYFATAWAVLALKLTAAQGEDVAAVNLPRAYQYLQRHLSGQSLSMEEQALALYVLADTDRFSWRTFEVLYAQRDKLALFSKALLAGAWMRTERASEESPMVRTLVDEIVAQARVEAHSVTFTEKHPERYARFFSSDTRSSALVLLALISAQPTHDYIPKIVRGLVEAARQGAYRSTQTTAWTLLALNAYAQKLESATPRFTALTTLDVAGQLYQLSEERFEQVSWDARTVQRPLSGLPLDHQKRSLRFSVEGEGQLHYSARLHYLPKEMPTEAADRGLVVQRWYSSPEGDPKTQLLAVEEGQLVRVHLRIASPVTRHYVAIEDPLPSGLEAVDPALKTTAALVESIPGLKSDAGDFAWWRGVFDYRELRDDRARLFATYLPAGVHSFSYMARATTAGTFVRPPARAHEMYHPEISGRSEAGQFWVHPKTEVSAR